jgi:hypothetical protein
MTMAERVELLTAEQRAFLQAGCERDGVTEPMSAEVMADPWLFNVSYPMVARVLALEAELAELRAATPAENDQWQWGVHTVNLEHPDDPEFEGDEWHGTEANARKWLHTPRQGPVRMSLIRRRPAKPPGPVETVEESPDDRR